MALGLCCEWVDIDRRGQLVNQISQRDLRLGRVDTYGAAFIRETYLANIDGVSDLLQRAVAAGIRFVRISSSVFPLFDKVPRGLWDNGEVVERLRAVGRFIVQHRLRVNTHPGQFVVLSSERDDVVDKSLIELDFHGWLFDQMGLDRSPYYGINVHGGKGGRPDRLLAGIDRLSAAARERLTLENDEFAYSVEELAVVCRKSAVSMVVDVHHHSLNPGSLTTAQALDVGRSTWPAGVKPTTHLSNSRPEHLEASVGKRRIHSDYISTFQADLLALHVAGIVDVEVEAKAKNIAIKQLVESGCVTLT